MKEILAVYKYKYAQSVIFDIEKISKLHAESSNGRKFLFLERDTALIDLVG